MRIFNIKINNCIYFSSYFNVAVGFPIKTPCTPWMQVTSTLGHCSLRRQFYRTLMACQPSPRRPMTERCHEESAVSTAPCLRSWPPPSRSSCASSSSAAGPPTTTPRRPACPPASWNRSARRPIQRCWTELRRQSTCHLRGRRNGECCSPRLRRTSSRDGSASSATCRRPSANTSPRFSVSPRLRYDHCRYV